MDRKEKGPKLILVTLILDDPTMVVMGYEPVLAKEKVVGFVTSAGYSYRLGKGIVYALLSPETVNKEVDLNIEYFGKVYTAQVMKDSTVVI
jgi:glycine cleavage system aminomethyltransferase T